jgi:hypothetical protein
MFLSFVFFFEDEYKGEEEFFKIQTNQQVFFQIHQKKWDLACFWWEFGVCGGDFCDS